MSKLKNQKVVLPATRAEQPLGHRENNLLVRPVTVERVMEIWEQISRQRVQYIVDSYQLAGEDDEDFDEYLQDLLQAYAPPQIELALVEALIASWQITPLVRGVSFLMRSHQFLREWENKPINPQVSPMHFQLITGLDPTPIYGARDNSQMLNSRNENINSSSKSNKINV